MSSERPSHPGGLIRDRTLKTKDTFYRDILEDIQRKFGGSLE